MLELNPTLVGAAHTVKEEGQGGGTSANNKVDEGNSKEELKEKVEKYKSASSDDSKSKDKSTLKDIFTNPNSIFSFGAIGAGYKIFSYAQEKQESIKEGMLEKGKDILDMLDAKKSEMLDSGYFGLVGEVCKALEDHQEDIYEKSPVGMLEKGAEFLEDNKEDVLKVISPFGWLLSIINN